MKLAEWMEAFDVSDEALAVDLDVDRSTVSRLRRGRQRPSWVLVPKIIKRTAGLVSADDFVGRKGGAPPGEAA